MKKNTKDKGDELESAVEAIESFIFSSTPSLKNSTISFERKKIITLKGARSEIDIFIKIDHGKGYDSIFLFECKNWNKKVGKNEIIVFSEKIAECNAQKGFMIAKDFTKDALNRAKNDGRIELHRVRNEISIDFFPVEHYLTTITTKGVTFRGLQSGPLSKSAPMEFNHQPVKFHELLNILQAEVDMEIDATNPTLKLKEHCFEYEKKFEFPHGSFKYDGKEVNGIKAIFELSVKKTAPIVISQYDVENRGRYYIIEHRTDAGVMSSHISAGL